jgi:hypothetical protein
MCKFTQAETDIQSSLSRSALTYWSSLSKRKRNGYSLALSLADNYEYTLESIRMGFEEDAILNPLT